MWGLRLDDGRAVVVKVRPGLHWDTADREAAWAAGLWVRAFDAKEAAQHSDPDTVLTQPEARTRLELAGLNPNLGKQ